MTIFTVFVVIIMAPLLKCLARLASFILVFPLALIAMLIKTCFLSKRRNVQYVG